MLSKYAWRCRHFDRPDLFDEMGRWREGVDRMAVNPPRKADPYIWIDPFAGQREQTA